MVRSERYKYIKYNKDPFIQLFDLEEDPEETTNIADRPDLARLVEQHAAMLADFKSRLEPMPG